MIWIAGNVFLLSIVSSTNDCICECFKGTSVLYISRNACHKNQKLKYKILYH